MESNPIRGPRAGVRPTLATIVATLGPATDSPGMVKRLIEAGVGVFRLNFSHGTLDEHAKRVASIREAARELGTATAIMGDLQGPKIRVGVVDGDAIEVAVGDEVRIEVGDRCRGRRAGIVELACPFEGLVTDVEPGDRVLINDGMIRMLAVGRGPTGALTCRVTVGGRITSRKGINLPDTRVRAGAITARDWECVEWAVHQGLDFLAMSFVRRAAEIVELRQRLAGMCSVDHATDARGEGALIPVVAKIEKPEAVREIDSIVEAADAIMVARGDLGVELDLVEVPEVQKRLVAKAAEWGKPCIVATQMFESMIESATPTRAEVSDVANAIFDGADAVMLSGETAVGKHPDLVVETMRRVVEAAERQVVAAAVAPTPPRRLVESRYRTAALAHGACQIARDIGAILIVCWSQKGGTARYLSQYDSCIPILAYSSDERQTRRMALLKGVTPRWLEVTAGMTLAQWNRAVDDDLLSHGWARQGEPVVLVAGCPLGEQGATTALAVHYVGNPMMGFMAHGG
ncbi:MAG: pyruvate kinase [Phycisphaeraceae bacterium]|nr:pyruvate kinase [Phycisphaeraceae bacterium]